MITPPEQAKILGPASEQRTYKPHGMPKRDAQTQRLLEKVLGHKVQDTSTNRGEIPNDLLVTMNQIISQNNALTAQIPTILQDSAKMKQEFSTVMSKLQDVLAVLAPVVQSISGAKKIDTNALSPNSPDIPELPNFAKDKARKKSSLIAGDLPPSES